MQYNFQQHATHCEYGSFTSNLNCIDCRRAEWLKRIGREEVGSRASSYWRVCEEHFDNQAVLLSPNRKVLVKNSLPKHRLPARQFKTRATQTFLAKDYPLLFKTDSGTQTTESLLAKRSRKRKGSKCGESTNFWRMCDRFLSKKLAKLVKREVRLAFASHCESPKIVIGATHGDSASNDLVPLRVACVNEQVDANAIISEEDDKITVKTELNNKSDDSEDD